MKTAHWFVVAACCALTVSCNPASKETSGTSTAAPPKTATATQTAKTAKGTPEEFFKAVGDADLAKVREYLAKDPSLAKAKGGNVNETALAKASFSGKKDLAEALIKAGSDVNATDDYGVTPLHGTARMGYPEIAALLIANKADVNAKTKSGQSVLSYAAEFGQLEVVKLLLDKGADTTIKDNGGKTALDVAKEEEKKADPGSKAKFKAIEDAIAQKK